MSTTIHHWGNSISERLNDSKHVLPPLANAMNNNLIGPRSLHKTCSQYSSPKATLTTVSLILDVTSA